MGDAGDDQIFGGAGSGDDHIWGGAGDDIISGGGGHDVLTGGTGNDFFVFDAPLFPSAQITDFTNAPGNNDRFKLDNAVMPLIGDNGGLNPMYFRNGPSAVDHNDYIIYNRADGHLYYDSNASFAGGTILLAVLDTKPALTAGDFAVI